jgi:branched-chain amino acid transport system ATP-binding protein
MAEALLQLEQLVKRFGGLVATDQLSLEVRRGEIHAIIGPNGAGKTTLLQQISGALPSDSGKVIFDGRDISHEGLHRRVRRGLARSYQITNIFTRLSVLDNLALAVQARSGSSMRFWRAALDERALFNEAAVIAERVGLADSTAVTAGSLSHGSQRQLELGITLATRPALLLLDEPMAGMGHEEAQAMVPLIESLRADHAVLIVEHDMDAVFRLADRISVLVAGKVIATGTPDAIRNNVDVKKAYLGDEVAL